MKTPGQSGLPGRPLIIAAIAQGLQAVLLVGLGVATLIIAAGDNSDDLLGAVLVGVLSLAGGVGLLAVARGLLRAQGWARSPALVWQLIMIPVGFTTLDDRPGVAYPLLISAAVVLAGLFAPSSTAALEDLYPDVDPGSGN